MLEMLTQPAIMQRNCYIIADETSFASFVAIGQLARWRILAITCRRDASSSAIRRATASIGEITASPLPHHTIIISWISMISDANNFPLRSARPPPHWRRKFSLTIRVEEYITVSHWSRTRHRFTTGRRMEGSGGRRPSSGVMITRLLSAHCRQHAQRECTKYATFSLSEVN